MPFYARRFGVVITQVKRELNVAFIHSIQLEAEFVEIL